jgi:beta-mannosidase
MQLVDHELKSDWRLKRRSLEIKNVLDELRQWDTAFAYFGSITVPSEAHVELLKTKLIPDPYVGFNEHKVQCE